MANSIRRIYIIPKSMAVADAIPLAKANNCAEIVSGIPPLLKHEVFEKDLPCVYEEKPIPDTSRNILEELDELKARVEKLENAKI